MTIIERLFSFGLYLLGFTLILAKPAFLKKLPISRNYSLVAWSGICLLLYFILLELGHVGTFYFMLPLAMLVIFFYFYSKDKARLLNGLLFNLFLLSLGVYALYLMMHSYDFFLGILLVSLAVAALLLLLFGVYGLILFLFANAAIVLRRESRTLGNLLTLLLGIALTIYLLLPNFLPRSLPNWALSLLGIPTLLLAYFFIVFINFLTSSVLYQLNRPQLNQDFIIILGAGLLNGEKVTPLLAKRIDRGIAFYREQIEKTFSSPVLLMSGGQGKDEHLPEAVAMKRYALEQGVPERDIETEVKSTTTLENMRFCKAIMDKKMPQGYRAIFVSNNYHIFRAGIFARSIGLKADGIGAKTAKYFIPNAFLREFAALLMMNKRRHIITCGLLIIAALAFSFFEYKYSLNFN